ncbi:hypothetical protein Tco_0812500 [Tanacetum coccineum]
MANLEFCDKHNIVNWEYILLGMSEAKDSEVCKITRVDGTSSFHGDFQALLRRLDRQDLFQLYSLVQERYKHHPLEGHDLDLWGDLKMIFDPNEEDDICQECGILFSVSYPYRFYSVEVRLLHRKGAATVASPVGVLELDTHSSSEVDPSESSLPPVSVAPMVSPFMCLDDLESDTKIPERHVSPTTSTPEIPTTPILPAPSAIVAPSSDYPLAPGIDSEEVDHSSSRYSLSGHSLSGHTPPETTNVDSSKPLRFVHSPLTRTPRCSDAYLHWRSTPLSTMSPVSTVTSPIHITRALVPSRADLLPPRKRFRDSISLEDSVKEDIDTDVLEDIKAYATAVEVVVDRDVEARIDARIDIEVDVRDDVEDEVEDEVESSDRGTMEVRVDMVAGIDIPDGMLMPNAVERLEQVEEGLQNIYDHVIEIPLQRIEDIKTGHRGLEARSLIAGRERARLLE